jgi:hypothetical protein
VAIRSGEFICTKIMHTLSACAVYTVCHARGDIARQRPGPVLGPTQSSSPFLAHRPVRRAILTFGIREERSDMRNKSLKEAMLLNVRDYFVLLSAPTLQSCCIKQRLSASRVYIYIYTYNEGIQSRPSHPGRWGIVNCPCPLCSTHWLTYTRQSGLALI